MEISELYRIFEQHPVVTTDSRDCPKDSIFFALKGASFNGNAFAQKAIDEGCAFAVGMGSNVTTDETSAIDGILIDGDMPADSVTAADGKVYNLNGQVVATSYRQFQALPGGVYVVNGKKVVK